MLDDTIVHSRKYFKRKLFDKKKIKDDVDEFFKIREQFIRLIQAVFLRARY